MLLSNCLKNRMSVCVGSTVPSSLLARRTGRGLCTCSASTVPLADFWHTYPAFPNCIYNSIFKSRFVFFYQLRKTGIQEPSENSLSSKSRAPRTTPPLQLNETENTEQDDLPADCSAVYNRGEHTSGVYTIKPRNSQGFNVYCDTQSGSPWTLIQHRKDGSQDFNETWENYEKGFGRLDGEFWLGLEKIYAIVQQSNYILRLELQDWKDSKHYVEYSFHLGSHETNYTLHVAEIAGNIPGALPEHTDLMFSTWNHRAKGQLYCPESYSGISLMTTLSSKYPLQFYLLSIIGSLKY